MNGNTRTNLKVGMTVLVVQKQDVGIAFNLTLNLFFIPLWQARGAAIATVITQTFVAGGLIWLCARYFQFRMYWQRLLQTAGFAVFVIGADWLIFSALHANWLLKFGLALLTGMTGGLLFRMVRMKQVAPFFGK